MSLDFSLFKRKDFSLRNHSITKLSVLGEIWGRAGVELWALSQIHGLQ